MWNAAPTIVAEDGPHRTILWLPPQSTYGIGTDLFGDWTYEYRVLGRGQLRITEKGNRFSTFLFTNEDGGFRGWYVNIERPQVRKESSFDYEDELEEAVRLGFVTTQRASEIRAIADWILSRPPWPTGLEVWRPPAGWQVPDLPPGWEEL